MKWRAEALARQALIIEQHYGRPMDIECALDCHSERSEESLRKNSIDFSLCSK